MTTEPEETELKAFQNMIMGWWTDNARDLPWRLDPSPYNVLVSEIMLQQTQVSRVVPKFIEFKKEFPTVESLADAKTKHLLKIWSGLGYNRRAIWLKEAARQIVQRGGFPQSAEELRKLKGVGPYTSRSILIFAFNKDLAAVDTNIRRVLIASGFADETMSDMQVQQVADRVLLKGRSSDWHNALMDYGSQVLTSGSTGISPKSSQSCYEGSTRQVRGEIVKILTSSDTMEFRELKLRLDCELNDSELSSIIDDLVADGLVQMTATGTYRIVE
ncbi:MAG: Fe-S cluster assembly protein HesB [Candidatus Thorarchaeota archaeon]